MNYIKKLSIFIFILSIISLLYSCGTNEVNNINSSINNDNSDNKEIVKNIDKEKFTINKKEPVVNDDLGVYTMYSPELLSSYKGKIVLFFNATWCPSCQSADKRLSSENIPKGLTILKLDYDSNVDLRKKYEILAQHTFVQVDNKGNMIKKWYGGRSSSDIIEHLK